MKQIAFIICVHLCSSVAMNAQQASESSLRQALQANTGTVTLPAGIIEISREIVLPSDAHDLDIRGTSTTIKASAAFRGRALLVLPAGKNIKVRTLSLDGNRDAFPQTVAPAPSASMLSRVVANNGILAEGVIGLELAQLTATQFPGFAFVVNGGRNIRIHDVEITQSGSLDASGHNNGSGGILLEEGVADFEILHALIGKVRGNGIWVRSTAPAGAATTAATGRIADCEFAILGRAAIELNHAAAVTIENNTGHMIGFPGEEVFTGGNALPAAITMTGEVGHSLIRNNNFGQLAGRCLYLDGFNDGEVTGNECADGLFNGFLIRGARNRVTGNRLTAMNSAHRDQPESLRIGIYLAGGSTGNTVESNEVAGYGMAKYCIGGPALAANHVAKNVCSDGASVARLLPGIRH